MRALDLFCGEGGASMGLHRAGFEVTGVDILPQPRYPFTFVQADALKPPFDLTTFDLVWASPPCQGYSRTRHLPWLKGRKHPLLIPAVRELLKGCKAYVIENVGDSPLVGPTLCGSMFGLKVWRHRKFETNFLLMAPPHGKHETHTPGRMFGGRLRTQGEHLGVDWMSSKGRSQAIPPIYAEFIARASCAV